MPHCRGYGIMVITVADGQIATITGFPDPALFPVFGLPLTCPDHGTGGSWDHPARRNGGYGRTDPVLDDNQPPVRRSAI